MLGQFGPEKKLCMIKDDIRRELLFHWYSSLGFELELTAFIKTQCFIVNKKCIDCKETAFKTLMYINFLKWHIIHCTDLMY